MKSFKEYLNEQVKVIKKKNDKVIFYLDNDRNEVGYDTKLNKYYIFYNEGGLSEFPIHYSGSKFGFDNPENISNKLKNIYKSAVKKFGDKPTSF